MNETDFNALLEEVKSYLNFTWTDAAREERIKYYINSSIAYLEEVAGVEIDINADYLAKDLLLNRVLYMDSQALDDFLDNYNSYLEELKIKYIPRCRYDKKKFIQKRHI